MEGFVFCRINALNHLPVVKSFTVHGNHLQCPCVLGSRPLRPHPVSVIRAEPPVQEQLSIGEDEEWVWTEEDTHTAGEEEQSSAVKSKRNRRAERDEYKESSRVYFRTVFDFSSWAAHRSTTRYIRHVSGIFKSRLVRGLAAPLIFVTGLSISVALGQELLISGILTIPDPLKDILFLNSALPMTLTSTVLGLLLVFRTNASYSRWLDARKNWGLLVNRSRDLVRQGLTWFPTDEQGQEMRDMLCRWIIALAYCMKCHVRENENAVEKLEKLEILELSELQALQAARHRPVFVLQVLSLLLREMVETSPQSKYIVGNMERNLTELEDVCGSCERILKTPIPLSYTRHTSRFMIIWLSLLPFALWEPCRWGMVPVTVAISLLTLGVEEIGVIIEEPFSVLPLETLCASIAADVRELRISGSLHIRENALLLKDVNVGIPAVQLLEKIRRGRT